MLTTIKSLKVSYQPVNEKNTFTNGDCVSGAVTLELAKECEMESLMIKFKGKAEVLWTERYGQTTHVYHSKDKYFSIKHYFFGGHPKSYNSNVAAPGCHVYPFTFQIPFLIKDNRLFISVFFYPFPHLYSLHLVFFQTPQHESKDKKMKILNSGMVAMDLNLEKTGFFQGEGLKVLACIQNNSTRNIKPKYCVYRKHSFFAQGKRKCSTKDLLKEVGEPIVPSATEKFTKVIPIPLDAEPSILNCSIIKAEYRLRVYLDVKYASDPEIKFDIVILPAQQVPALLGPQLAASDFGLEPFGGANPPVWGFAPPQPPADPGPLDPPPPYGAYGMYPPLTDFGNKEQ
uniref:Zgc:110626 n=1 Tax=Gasterosteus aculeatus aculeatus TaxID=481459 RepID=G3P766_GASAC